MHHDIFVRKNQQDALVYSQFISIIHVLSRFTAHHQEVFSVYAAIGMCHAENNRIM